MSLLLCRFLFPFRFLFRFRFLFLFLFPFLFRIPVSRFSRRPSRPWDKRGGAGGGGGASRPSDKSLGGGVWGRDRSPHVLLALLLSLNLPPAPDTHTHVHIHYCSSWTGGRILVLFLSSIIACCCVSNIWNQQTHFVSCMQ